MPSAQIPLPRAAAPPRHLYRHLLREASYLPPICATYISARIKTQYRKHHHDKIHVATRTASGVRKLRHLQAANAGDPKHLHSVFLHTFGRTGPLRRSLLAPLLLPDPPAASDSPQPAAAPPQTNPNVKKNPNAKQDMRTKARLAYERARMDTRHKKHLVDRWDFEKLQNFMQSQIEHTRVVAPAVWRRERPARWNPAPGLPEKNIWGHDLPLRELRSRLKSWWKTNINKLMPPLGAGEFQTLRELATKNEVGQLLRIPPRRPVAAPVQEEGACPGGAWDWRAYASLPASQIERERRAGFQESIHGYRYDPVPVRAGRPSNRKLRRTAGKVFEASSYIKRDENTAKSKIIWGNLAPDLPAVSPAGSTFFEGLDDKGSTPQPEKTPRRSEARRGRQAQAQKA